MKVQNIMKQQNIYKTIIGESLWVFICLALGSLYAAVDIYFMAHLPKEINVILANWTTFNPLIGILTAFGFMIVSGTSDCMAIEIGKKRKNQVEAYLGAGLTLSFIVGGGLTGLLLFSFPHLVNYFCFNALITDEMIAYLKTVIYFMPIYLLSIYCNVTLVVDGHVKVCAVINGIGLMINMLANWLGLKYFALSINCIAIATGIAQGITVMLTIAHFTIGNSTYKLRKEYFKVSKKQVYQISRFGFSSATFYIGAGFVQIMFNYYLVQYGGYHQLSAMAIIASTTAILMLPVRSISFCIEPLIAYSYGTKDYKSAEHIFYYGVFLSTIVLLVVDLFILTNAHKIIGIFTTNLELRQLTVKNFRIYMAMLPTLSLSILTPMYLRCIGETKLAGGLSLLRQFIIFIPLLVLLAHFNEVDGIWATQAISDILTTIIMFVFLYIRNKRKAYKDKIEREVVSEILSKI